MTRRGYWAVGLTGAVAFCILAGVLGWLLLTRPPETLGAIVVVVMGLGLLISLAVALVPVALFIWVVADRLTNEEDRYYSKNVHR